MLAQGGHLDAQLDVLLGGLSPLLPQAEHLVHNGCLVPLDLGNAGLQLLVLSLHRRNLQAAEKQGVRVRVLDGLRA